MKIKFYGTRGSVPISNPESINFGGNTTCLRVHSDCLPRDIALAIDAGTGFVPMGKDLVRQGNETKEIIVLFTHYHHDHTQGLFLSPLTFNKKIRMRLLGPVDSGKGPREMMEEMMRPPYFPVHFKQISSHIIYKGLDFPSTFVIIFHPKGGYKMMNINEYEKIVSEGEFLPVGKGKYPVKECLIVTMHKSRHPEQTISYRFEEKPTGRIFVFLTDHENTDGISVSLKEHTKNADLIVMDSQFTRETYNKFAAGYGHGTPDYCARVAEEADAKKLGLTHHDPSSTDDDIKDILREAEERCSGGPIEIFACIDYQEVEV